MHRFFVSPQDLAGRDSELVLEDSEVLHHLRTVLRIGPGEDVLLLDGHGTVARCRLQSLGKKRAVFERLEQWTENDSAFPVTLLQALPKGDKMDLVLQKGTELGVAAFFPVVSERTLGKIPGGKEDKRLARWQRIVSEAARQCRRPCLPCIQRPVVLQQALDSCSQQLKLMLWEEGSLPLPEVLGTEVPRDAAILIGPEGGFSSEEAEKAMDAGFVPVRLGPRILRTETAGFAMAGILQYLFGDLATGGGRTEK